MRKPGAPRECVSCGVTFSPKRERKRGQRYCSRRCVFAHVGRGEYTAERSAKIGDAQRDRGACKTYRKLHQRHEHRVVAEQKLGRALLPGEIVHHIDRNVRNNDPDNLQVMTQSEHMKLHSPDLRRKPS